VGDEAIRELARGAGIATDWIDATGQRRRVAIGPLRAILSALGYPCGSADDVAESRARLTDADARQEARPLVTATAGEPIRLASPLFASDRPAEIIFEDGHRTSVHLRAGQANKSVAPAIDRPGYHRLRFGDDEIMLAVAQRRCVTLDDIAPGERLWGLAVQTYSLRRSGDGGIGDTTALQSLATSLRRHGADAIALSPSHSLFPADPSRYGPYSPSSRLFLNPLFADPATVFGAARVTAAMNAIPPDDRTQCERASLIDWPTAARGKYAVLSRLYDDFVSHDLQQTAPTKLAADFASFEREGGDHLREHALFEALHRKWLGAEKPLWSWSEWPAEWRDPSSTTVAEYAAGAPRDIQYQAFLQWIADRSFAAAQSRARAGGMRIGLIADLAIGMDRGGSHAWARQKDLLLALSVGAPPDLFNPRGQDWGLTGFSPQSLVANGFEPFLATLRAAMRHAGGVRIDHAMGLTRLWLIPHGASAADGAYLTYPIDDLLRLIALESHRHRAIVIGEDLGTVPPEFRGHMTEAGICGMDVLWFEREGSEFKPPGHWRRDAVAMTTTHDLPTVAGWWSGADIATREELGLAPQAQSERDLRAGDRTALWRAFANADAAEGAQPERDNAAPAVDAAVRFVAKAAAPLVLIPIEDVLGLGDQPNLPGTIDQHPNWRRRLDAPASSMLDTPQAQPRLEALRRRGG
jgi:4-alpha-glucanotransferase